MKKFVWRKGQRVQRNPTPYPVRRCDGHHGLEWPHEPHDHMAIVTDNGVDTFNPFWCDGAQREEPEAKVKSTPLYAATTEVIPAVQNDRPRHMTPNDIADLYDVPRDMVTPSSRQNTPDTAQASLPPTQGPTGQENAATVESDGSTWPQWEALQPGEPVGSPRNPIRFKDGALNQLAVDCTHDGIYYMPWDDHAVSTGDRQKDFQLLVGEFHPAVRSAIEEVRRDRADSLGRTVQDEDRAQCLCCREDVKVVQRQHEIFNDADLLETAPGYTVHHGGPGVPTVNTPMALHFAGTVQSGDLIVIKDEHGHELLSLRVKDGVVQARYYEGDISKAAERFFDFLMDFVPPEPPPHDWQEYNASGNTCHYPKCRKNQVEH